ncbi:hypothetical protein ABNQ24_12425 [Ralstonia pseudosolanacearum]|uniref:hypothetical protein n=1 Tax=Ralstonia pseudosolanacearum TaxID=1310165 RepID=UPI00336A9C57
MAKRPAFQFYPADWRKDTALQGCSLLARGLWHEMLCLMHECEPYGHLSVNGKPMKPSQIARLVGITEKEYGRLLEELFDAGVPSRTDDGCIYSRRMVRDEHIRNVRAEAGKKGGNPDLLAKKVKQKDKQTDNHQPNLGPTPSSSSSSTENTSIPDGMDADASMTGLDAKDAIWQIAVPWLLERQVANKSARSLLGAAIKQLGSDEAAWSLCQRMFLERPIEPAAWLAGAINAHIKPTAARQKGGRQDALEQANRDVAAQVAAEIEGAGQ